jgi:tripartite-type tricarboxylate transporter receptor subunit TctC
MIKLSRRTVLAGLSAIAVVPARAEAVWPSRTITLMHGFPPGGPVDTLSRILADGLSKRLGQSVAVEPKPGASGTTAGGLVAHAAADGYTLMAAGATFTATAAMFNSLPYKPTEDFTFISTTAEFPLVLVTHPDSPIHSVADLIRIARSNKNPLQYGTAGLGSLMHLAMELFAKEAHIQLQHIPYQGGMPAITDLLAKRVDLVLDPPTVPLQFVKDDKLRPLAVTGASRFFALPDVPTMVEIGIPGYVVTGFQGIAAPPRLPDAITTKINRALADVLSEPAVIEKLKKAGNSPKPSSPEECKARVVADIALWKNVVAEAHLARI